MVINLLYVIAISLLGALGVLVWRYGPNSPLHRHFAWTCAALIAWLGTLYVLVRSHDTSLLTTIGRINFTSVLLAVTWSFQFIAALARFDVSVWWRKLIAVESVALTVVTVFTPLIDLSESVRGAEHVTTPGSLFVLFAAHVIAYPLAAGIVGILAMRRSRGHTRDQLLFVATGILMTAGINIVTGIVLPYRYGIFAYEEIGALSAVVFAGTVAYAILVDRLFDIRIVIRKTLVIAALIAFVQEAYSLSISLFVEHPGSGSLSPLEQKAVSMATVLFIAVTFHPLKEWLERRLGRMLGSRRTRLRT